MDLIYQLDQEFQKLLTALDNNPIARRLYEGNPIGTEYEDFLIQVYKYVLNTSPFLARAAEVLVSRNQHPELAYLCAHKAIEEDHAEWPLADLNELGVSKDVVDRTPPAVGVAIYNNWHISMIEKSPLVILGTAYMLESLSVQRAGKTARNLTERSGIRAVRFLTGHDEADGGHVSQLQALLEQVPPLEQAPIVSTAAVVRVAYVHLFP
jgi:thiaminase